jgi:hypothetical protein
MLTGTSIGKHPSYPGVLILVSADRAVLSYELLERSPPICDNGLLNRYLGGGLRQPCRNRQPGRRGGNPHSAVEFLG